jgi:dTDP-4-dehydrorhamnose reductase
MQGLLRRTPDGVMQLPFHIERMDGMTFQSGSSSQAGIALWGGVECTFNRVRDRYFNQLESNGHALRLDDLDRFASLGIKAIRYPVLWEHTAPEGLEKADWRWADERLNYLRELGITPIAGLVHHGSGPRDTSLVDPDFPDKLASYAAAVAQRFPWLEYYTPINEPLTTARFSGLYGIWYPHGQDEPTFKTALFNQCRATVLAMRAIRAINPNAKLVQTEDLGKTYSTPRLSYQAYFNNQLRWLAGDLLCGKVTPEHYLWDWLVDRCKATEEELFWFCENTCPPDILGMNHYITSERFLDENLDNYPRQFHGGNGRHRYVDIEAARALHTPTGGIKPLLMEAWERYGLPIAITEVHIDSHREEQMRWLAEVWSSAAQARQEGADIRAVTVWSLLGSYDWNSLVTLSQGYYEPGPFDLRSSEPRPTAIAQLMRELADGREPLHPVLSGPGWWRRQDRFLCSRPVELRGVNFEARPELNASHAPLLITGSTGTLGQAFARVCELRGIRYKVLNRQQMDIADINSVERVVAEHEPWAIINTAGYVRVDDAEHDAERCFRENTLGPNVLADVCARHGMQFVTFSTDFVFNGRRDEPYVENDEIGPLNIYGRSKAESEYGVLNRHPEALVIRTSSFFGPWDQYNFITTALSTLQQGKPFRAANDLTVSPTYVPDLVNVSLDLLLDRASGIWHLTNGHAVTWSELALHAAERAQVAPHLLQPCSSEEFGFIAARPRYSALHCSRGALMPPLDHALDSYLRHMTEIKTSHGLRGDTA